MTASASDRVKGIVRKAKDMVGLGEKGTTTEKIKDTIDRTADKAKGAVDEVSEVVSEGKDKAKEVAKQAGKKVKAAGKKIEDSAD